MKRQEALNHLVKYVQEEGRKSVTIDNISEYIVSSDCYDYGRKWVFTTKNLAFDNAPCVHITQFTKAQIALNKKRGMEDGAIFIKRSFHDNP